jgi:carboxypeptidase T
MNYKYRLFFFSLLIGTSILLAGIILDSSVPASASDQPTTGVYIGADSPQKTVVRIYYESQEQLNAVAGELDIWEVHQLPEIGTNSGYALAAVYPSQQDWLKSLGYRLEMDPEHTDLLQTPSSLLDPRYFYFDNYVTNPNNLYMVNFLQETATISPSITQLIDIGDSWLSLHLGYHRDMWVLRITSEDPVYGTISAKPPFFLFANVHAREVTTPEMAIRYIKYMTTGYNGLGGYGKDPDVTWLVNHHVVYVLVSQNPDGRVLNEQNTGNYRRKNMDNDDGCIDPNSWGVDLNRNSSFKWGCCGGSSNSPCSELYRGPVKGSEPETQAFQTYFSSVFIDQNGNNGDDIIPPAAPNNATGIFISLHTYGDYVLWPWGFGGDAPNGQQLQTIGRKLAFLNGLNPLKFLYTVDGATDDWTYGKFGVASFTYEIGDDYGSCGDFFPAYGCQDGIDGMPRNFWAEMKPSFIYANKIARTPYITAYGPDTTDLLTDPDSVPVGIPVSLTGTIEDTRYGDDPTYNVYAAEYFIDSEGVDGTGITLSPIDGSWGEVSEDVYAEIDTSNLALGQHYILVHGKTKINSTDYWGPFTAIYLEIIEPLDLSRIYLAIVQLQ